MTRMKQHPVVIKLRPHDWEERLADEITKFAGSMMFVYIHVVLFTAWIVTKGFGADPFPFNFLTMTVSLEAIFLATFVMIGQNRQAMFQQAKADHDWQTMHKDITAIKHHLGIEDEAA